ncbi:MAG: hypothetical protein AAFR38_01935 [Planctomycetota bacterium]
MLAATGFRTKGRYWTWRHETAEGARSRVTRAERRRAALEYGAWAARLARLK